MSDKSQAQQLIKQRGGKRAKKQKKHTENPACRAVDVKDVEGGQEYAQVERTLGNCRFTVRCFDGKTRLAHVRGRLTRGRNRHDNFISDGDYVLVGTRDYEPGKCDILLKYTHDQVKQLIRQGELPAGSTLPTRIGEVEADDTGFDFEGI